MKSPWGLLLPALALWLAVCPAWAEEPRCGPDGTVQELGACAREACRRSEAELSALRERVLDRYKGNEAFLAIFRESQASWQESVDEEMRVAFHCDGEADPACFRSNLEADYFSYKNLLLRDRIDRVNRYLEARTP